MNEFSSRQMAPQRAAPSPAPVQRAAPPAPVAAAPSAVAPMAAPSQGPGWINFINSIAQDSNRLNSSF